MSFKFEEQLKRLNPAQKKAVETLDGPVMVVAGPGTGKTQILALRIANILKKTDSNPENILCLTFTEAGASAMRERLVSFIGNSAYKVSIHTFHSFCNEIIQTFPDKFSFSKELTQLDDLNRLKLLREIIDSENNLEKLKPFHDKYAKIRDIVTAIQTLKKESVDPEELKIRNDQLKQEHENNPQMRGGKPTKKWEKEFEVFKALDEFYIIYKTYQERLNTLGFYDYEDMIMFVIDNFKKDDSLLAHYQERFLYILVDEYQDTNGSQNEIIKLLGSWDLTPNIFVVGDDDQAIYRFQGANIGNILFFGKVFSNITMIPTTENYRSTQIILDIASSLIANNKTRLVNEYKDLEKKLKAFKTEETHKAEVWEFSNGTEENIFLAKEIEKLHSKGVNYNEIAILYRKNSHAGDIAEILNKFNIPNKVETSKSIFENIVINQFIDLLKVIYLYDKNQDELLYRVLLYEFLDINTADVYRICRYSNDKRKKIFDVINDESIINEIKLLNIEKINYFKEKIFEWHKINANVPFPKFIERVLTESGMLDFIAKASNEEDKDKQFDNVLSINSFYDFITGQYQLDRNLDLEKFIKDLDLIKENNIKISVPKVNSNLDSVNMLTAHSSKGLEFDYIFIIKSTDNNWGKNRTSKGLLPKEIISREINLIAEDVDLALEDERRLFFVAVTRARKKVYFTFANEYISEGTSTSGTISRFITEIDQKYLEYKSYKTNDIEFNINDYVENLKPSKTVNFSKDEEAFLKEQISKLKLSPSALCEYLDSPEQFKINRLIRVPKAKSKELALGSAIHFAFEKLNKKTLENIILSSEEFSTYFEESLKKEFYGDEEYDRTLEEGIKILNNYYDKYIRNGGYQPALEAEYNLFSHNIYFDPMDGSIPIPLTGRIDKIEQLGEKDEYTSEIPIKIIDYKTTRPKSENEIKGLTKNSNGNEWRQLVFYKLMSQLDTHFRPGQKSSGPRYNLIQAELDFLKPDSYGKNLKKMTLEINKEEVEELKILIIEVMKRIRNLEFPEECDLLN